MRAPITDDEKHPPLFPLRPETRPLRLGIDVTTVPTPPDGLLTRFFGRDEIDMQLLVPAGEKVPSAWTAALGDPVIRQVGFTSVKTAERTDDGVQFRVTTEGERERSRSTARFFDVYQQRDAQTAPTDAEPLSLEQRHHAAARTPPLRPQWASTPS